MGGTKHEGDLICPDKYVSKKYIALMHDVFNCGRCEGLNIPRETMSAPGYGAVPAQLMVVGQSLHGYNTQTPERQIPFIGPVRISDSGTLLYELLRRAGFTYEKGNMFVTNVIKCHPPDNQPSKSIWKKNCVEYLIKELMLVKPKIILCVGSDAGEAFDYSGRVAPDCFIDAKYRKSEERYYVMIKHPSFIMRFEPKDRREQYIKDCSKVLCRLRRLLLNM